MKTVTKFFSIISLLAILTLAFATPAMAFDGRSGNNITIEADEVIEDDLYVSAENFTLEGIVKGDLIVGGSNITINGPLTAQSNITAGIWMTATENTDSIKNVVIGQSGTVSLSSHNSGGVIVYGNIHSTTITANITRGIPTAAGILLLGVNTEGRLSPQNSVINNCTFSGYTTTNPAITLSSNIGHKSFANVSGTGNTFIGYDDAAAIETIVYHTPDDPLLGTVTLTNNNPLPVELVSFTASSSASQILLRWTTATEVNNYGFEIERKLRTAQNNFWETIGFVSGQGTSNVSHQYSFQDILSQKGTVEYRLKQIDHNGSFEYSQTIAIESKGTKITGTTLDIYPNPFNATSRIIVRVAETGMAKLTVVDLSGKEITRLFSGLLQEHDVLNIPIDGIRLSSGMYYCVMNHNSNLIVKKLLLLK